ncbi:hypothetical protein AAL_06437 [Moelleriella libera RCEF 2490]|uniref:Uncharacterized protein n=1 Tax=Moelleriella libera RCEF 2490 TaxID=1081109 RepID=A0A162ID10_9HYPO|nr:hypothetical protein AAL_06437 [Moelleriella libera RCEF 2490]
MADENVALLERLLSEETERRDRPKSLCYEDVSLILVRVPNTGEDLLAMAIKLIHHKGCDDKPKP